MFDTSGCGLRGSGFKGSGFIGSKVSETEVRRQKTEDSGQKTADRGQASGILKLLFKFSYL
jgi:hypothetical protein